MKKLNKELLSNIIVLYVEDEEMIRNEVTFFFQKYVKEFHCANNGIEGLALYKKVNPDIIITDIQMPKMNGLDMIREIDSTIPIIITTAYSDIEYFLKAIELNVNKFVIKPINLIDLIYDIQECITTTNLHDKLFEKDTLLKIIDENVLISITNKKGMIIDVSQAFCNLTGYSKTELLGKSHKVLKHPDTDDEFYSKMWAKILKGKVFSSEIRNQKKNGEDYWANLTITPVYKDNEINNFIAIREDVTNKKKLEQLSILDELTGLYNRRHFNKVIDKELRRSRRDNVTLSLLSIDVDHFKKYNDTYGHLEGDLVLSQISKVFKDLTHRSTDYVFRMGGEEFCIIFSNLSIEESLVYAQKIVSKVEALKIEHKRNDCSRYVTVSAGLAVQNPDQLSDVNNIYKDSDDALYRAKRTGKNRVVVSRNTK